MPSGPTLRQGDTGPEVAELENRLKRLGRWPRITRGKFTAALFRSVRSFQEGNRITDDPPGVYGPATRKKLEAMTP